MSENVHVVVNVGGGAEARLEFPLEGLTTGARVTQVADRQYRLDSFAWGTECAMFGDVIEVDRLDDGTLRFCRVAVRSQWNAVDFLLAEDYIESKELVALVEKVEKAGGYWERVMGGLLMSLPPHVNWNPADDVMKWTVTYST